MTDEQKPQVPAPAGNQQVQLGIGTLIIIALIVTMCSGRSETEKVQKDTAQIKQQVGEINRKLDELASRNAPAPAANVEAPDAGTSSAQHGPSR